MSLIKDENAIDCLFFNVIEIRLAIISYTHFATTEKSLNMFVYHTRMGRSFLGEKRTLR